MINTEEVLLDPVLQLGKQLVVTRSEVRAVRKVVRQPPDEILRHCLAKQAHISVEEHYTGFQHSVPLV
jgi:hypothetical protein